MADRKESSVLFSLRELKGIEKDRQREEEEAQRRAEADRVRAHTEAQQRVRAEAEARVQAQALAERQAREAAAEQARHERMRLEAQERDARARVQASLDQERLSKEMEIRAIVTRKKRPVALIAVAVILITCVVGLGGFLMYQHLEANKKERRFQAELLAMRQGIADSESKYEAVLAEEDKRYADLLSAKTETEKAQLAARYREIQRQEQAQRERLAALRVAEEEKRKRDAARAAREAEKKKRIDVKCKDPNDPLCGI